jgi:hypothetical protein
MGTPAQGTYIAKLQVQIAELEHRSLRWHSRLYRAVTVIKDLEAAKKRAVKRLEDFEREMKARKSKKPEKVEPSNAKLQAAWNDSLAGI